jgi:hypothetical protein
MDANSFQMHLATVPVKCPHQHPIELCVPQDGPTRSLDRLSSTSWRSEREGNKHRRAHETAQFRIHHLFVAGNSVGSAKAAKGTNPVIIDDECVTKS